MLEVICYRTFDGTLFEDQDKAEEYTEDKLGEELDGLLKLFNLDIERSREYKALLQLLKRKDELKKQIDLISNILNFPNNQF